MADPIGMFFDDLFDRLSRAGGAMQDRKMEDHEVEEALQHLKSLSIFELKRRGLWTAPPGYVGQRGIRWLEPGVLDEFVHDVFMFVLVERLSGLLNARKLGKKCGWRVRNFVGFFITERQKDADPIGYRVFGRLKAAVQKSLERGFLFLFGNVEDPTVFSDRAPELDNQSCLTYRRGHFVAAALDRLRDAARFLNDRLLPGLVTDEGRSVPKLVDRFADQLETVGKDFDEVEGFRLGELGKEQKDDARRRFQGFGLLERPTALDESPGDDDGGAATLVVAVDGHEETLDQWSDRRRLILQTVSDRIDALPSGQDRDELWKLWTLLKSTRLLSDLERAALRVQGIDDPEEPGLGEAFPKKAELQRTLKISSRRLPKMLDRLQALVGEAVLASTGSELTHRVNGTAVSSPAPPAPAAPSQPIAFPSHPSTSPEAGEPRS